MPTVNSSKRSFQLFLLLQICEMMAMVMAMVMVMTVMIAPLRH